MAQARVVKSSVQHNGEAWIGNKKNALGAMDSMKVFKTTWGWMGVATTSRTAPPTSDSRDPGCRSESGDPVPDAAAVRRTP